MNRRRTVDEAAADHAVLTAIRARGGVATRADLVVDTALPDLVVEHAVDRLLDEYVSSVGVARGGTLLYRFASGFPRRRERHVALRAFLQASARFVAVVARAAQTTFRVALALQLLVYTFVICLPVSVVVGVVVGIGMMIAGLFSDSGGDMLSLLLDPYGFVILVGICVVGGIGWAMSKEYELLLELVGARSLQSRERGLGALVTRVNAFALGPTGPRRNDERIDRTWTISQADERRVLARVRGHGGRLRAGDLVAWLGLSFAEADSQATRLAVEYEGEPAPLDGDVSVLEFRFASLMTTAGGRADGDADGKTRFERPEPAPRLTGNEAGHDVFIALFALGNLGASLLANHWLAPKRGAGVLWWLAWLAGARVPILFSVLLLALPVLRLPWHTVRKVRAQVARARARIVSAIVAHSRAHRSDALSLEKLCARLRHGDDALPDPTPGEARAVALELEGEFDLDVADDPSKTVWRFRRLATELAQPRGEGATLETVTQETLVDSGDN
jgi:hypothetical protein